MTALLLGGEMPHWSDRSPVRGAVLAALCRSVHGDTLVVGPHHPELIDAIPARQVTVLVRGVPDADELAARYADRPGVRVCCGSLAKLAAVPAYDTVIALDGLDRTGSTETADLSWSAAVAQLLAVLRPGGRLLLGLANPLGLDRLLAAAGAPGDADWATADDPSRPAGPGPLTDHLRAAGLEVSRDYAAYPDALEPTALLSGTALTDPDLHGVLTAALRRAGRPDGPLLADPRPLAADLIRHRLGAALAPAWIVVAAHPGDASHPLPEVMLADPADPGDAADPAGPRDTPVLGLRRTGPGWTWEPSGEPVPAGRCLHDVLLAAVRAGNHPELRALLTAWQSGPAATVTADRIVLTGDGHLHPLPLPAGAGADSPLDRFAAALHDEGLAHLWPADETTGLLAAMAGVPVPAPRPRPVPETLRELTASHERLTRQVQDLQTQLTWYERRTAALQSDLSRAHRIIAVLKGMPSGRAATAVLAGARTGKRLARAALRRLGH